MAYADIKKFATYRHRTDFNIIAYIRERLRHPNCIFFMLGEYDSVSKKYVIAREGMYMQESRFIKLFDISKEDYEIKYPEDWKLD